MTEGERSKLRLLALTLLCCVGLGLTFVWKTELDRLRASLAATSQAIGGLRLPDDEALMYRRLAELDAQLAATAEDKPSGLRPAAGSSFEPGTQLHDLALTLGFQVVRHQVRGDSRRVELLLQSRDAEKPAEFCSLAVQGRLPARLTRLSFRSASDGNLLLELEAEPWD